MRFLLSVLLTASALCVAAIVATYVYDSLRCYSAGFDTIKRNSQDLLCVYHSRVVAKFDYVSVPERAAESMPSVREEEDRHGRRQD